MATAAGGLDARMKLLCSHGGRLVPRGPGCAPRYEGGETRVLVVPRSATFRDLAARMTEMAGGAEVREIRHRLADCDEGLEDVLVSVTCDEELAHMRHEYDRLHATRPAARFRDRLPEPEGSGRRAPTTASSASVDAARAERAGDRRAGTTALG